ncbi:uncharacterized protein RHO25_009354 [Cercospora beticola]|nr:hypothetical protein RHO25_009354 [Cercospora beticola]CAK1364458.1 unnamed protein product [Cercospora beticola]
MHFIATIQLLLSVSVFGHLLLLSNVWDKLSSLTSKETSGVYSDLDLPSTCGKSSCLSLMPNVAAYRNVHESLRANYRVLQSWASTHNELDKYFFLQLLYLGPLPNPELLDFNSLQLGDQLERGAFRLVRGLANLRDQVAQLTVDLGETQADEALKGHYWFTCKTTHLGSKDGLETSARGLRRSHQTLHATASRMSDILQSLADLRNGLRALNALIQHEYDFQANARGGLSGFGTRLLTSKDMTLVSLHSLVEIREIMAESLSPTSVLVQKHSRKAFEAFRLDFQHEETKLYTLLSSLPSMERAAALKKTLCRFQRVL